MKTVWSKEIDKILKVGVNLEQFGVNNWAFNQSQAIEILEKLHHLNIAILGGDVYYSIEGIFQPNYDNWYCEKFEYETDKEFTSRSINKAIDYIKNYKIKDSENTFFVLVPQV